MFRDIDELMAAYELGDVDIHAPIQYRVPELMLAPANGEAAQYETTTVGRAFFNEALPAEYRSSTRRSARSRWASWSTRCSWL